MLFEEGHIYHVYNQGNNRQQIFFERENYLFFLRKMRVYLLPYCNIIAYCLMPNHFHWLIEVKAVDITHPMTPSHRMSNGATTLPAATPTHRMTPSHPMSSKTMSNKMSDGIKSRSLNDSIAIMLRSYTRAINVNQKRTGSLFRTKTKSECVSKTEGITPSFYNTQLGTVINIPNPEFEYPQICFDYIHLNPVKAKLVEKAEDWEFSSYPDYRGIRNGTLINRDCGANYGISFNFLEVNSIDDSKSSDE
ncbi:hypothetical protein MASR2M12_02680 [Bacteroidales bacterium]